MSDAHRSARPGAPGGNDNARGRRDAPQTPADRARFDLARLKSRSGFNSQAAMYSEAIVAHGEKHKSHDERLPYGYTDAKGRRHWAATLEEAKRGVDAAFAYKENRRAALRREAGISASDFRACAVLYKLHGL